MNPPFNCSRSIFNCAVVLLLTTSICFSQDTADAGTYLHTVNVEFGKISKEMMDYVSAANHGKSARKVEKRRGELILQTKESERVVRKLLPFKGESKLRDSIANYFRMCNLIINQDYGKIVNLEEIAEQSYDAMEAYMLAKEKAGEKISLAFDAADKEYKNFAAANNITLIESDSKLGKRLEAAGKVNDYYDKLYLIFFKSFKNEAYLTDALNKGNVSAVEQTRNALATSAEDDLNKIGPMQGFNGDATLKNAAQQLLLFYKTEATTKIPDQIDYFLAKEKFEKVKKAFDSKSSSSQTQADIDTFNEAVNDFNAKVKKSNQTNEELNKKRTALLKSWNQTSQSFLDNHTP